MLLNLAQKLDVMIGLCPYPSELSALARFPIHVVSRISTMRMEITRPGQLP